MSNSIFGKTLENKRKHKNVKLICDASKLEDLIKQPIFRTSVITNQNLVAVAMNPTKIVMDNIPLYVGMSILDISKTHMYDFHYSKMVTFYGRNIIIISYMDTDAFVYWIKTNYMYEDLKTFPYSNDFDFSDHPITHPTYDGGINKKVLGKLKDETNSVPITEIVALMSKVYAMETSDGSTAIEKAKGVKRVFL